MPETRRKVSLAVLLVLIVALGITFFRVVAPFILPLFLAGMTAVICQPLFRYFLMRTKEHVPAAAGLTTATILAAILIPLVTATLIGSLQLYTFASRISDSRQWLTAFRVPELAQQDEAELDETATDSDTDANTDNPTSDDEEGAAEAEDANDVTGDLESVETPIDSDLLQENPTAEAKDAATDDQQLPTLASVTEEHAETTDDTDVETAANEEGESALQAPAESNASQPVSKPQEPNSFEQVVNYVNGFLPKELQRTPPQVAEEIRSRIRTSLQEIGDRSLGRAAGTTFGVLAGVAGAVASALISLMMYIVALYYFLADGTALLSAAEKLIPVHAKYQKQLLEQFAKVVRSVVVATFFAAFAQGIATTAALWFFGFDHLMVLLMLSVIAALIPIAGTWLVWIPCAIILIGTGHYVQAFLLAIYGSVVVGFLDNVVRTYVLNSDVKLHPLLAFISILGGIQVMGLWGVFIGPIVASCLHALIKIFNHELHELTSESGSVPTMGTPAASS